MRDREYELTKPAGTFRIAVIGDSIAFGLPLHQRWNFSTQLEDLLASHYRREQEPVVEVLNFGVTGYNFSQVMEALRSRVLAFDPDLVFYAYALNDPQEYSLEMGNLLAQLTDAEERFLLVDGPSSFMQRSRLYQLVRYLMSGENLTPRKKPVWNEEDPQFVALREGRFEEYYADLNTAEETWQPIASGLVELAALSNSEDVPVHVVIFPTLSNLNNYPIPEVHAHLAREFSELSFVTLDLLEYYACHAKVRGADIAADSLHPNKTGHGLAAVVLLRHLLTTESLPGFVEDDFERVFDGSESVVADAHLTLEVERGQQGRESRCGPR
jgi:hypothetical protein